MSTRKIGQIVTLSPTIWGHGPPPGTDVPMARLTLLGQKSSPLPALRCPYVVVGSLRVATVEPTTCWYISLQRDTYIHVPTPPPAAGAVNGYSAVVCAVCGCWRTVRGAGLDWVRGLLFFSQMYRVRVMACAGGGESSRFTRFFFSISRHAENPSSIGPYIISSHPASHPSISSFVCRYIGSPPS